MSGLMNNYAKARRNCPQYTGVTEQIRAALRRNSEPLSVYKLSLMTGFKSDRIHRALARMISNTGGVISSIRPKGVRYYSIYRPMPKHQGSGQIAGRIIHGRGSFWGAGLV